MRTARKKVALAAVTTGGENTAVGVQALGEGATDLVHLGQSPADVRAARDTNCEIVFIAVGNKGLEAFQDYTKRKRGELVV